MEAITSHFGTDYKLNFVISENIVRNSIIQLFTGCDDILQRSERNYLFKFAFESKQYVVTLKKGSHFRMTIGNVSLAMSFR